MKTALVGYCCMAESVTVAQAMEAIDRGKIHLAFVTDEDSRLIGVISDGDIRRALLSSVSLASPAAPLINRAPTVVTPNTSPDRVNSLFADLVLSAIPVVDEDGKILGVVTPFDQSFEANDQPSAKLPYKQNVVAVIMAGGKGQRLMPLTENTPKPMLKVGDRPLIEQIVSRLVRSGITDIYISVNYLGEVIESHFGDGAKFGARIGYLREEKALGTAGALTLLPDSVTGPLLVLNGDIIVGAEYPRVLNFHRAMGGELTVAVARHEFTIPFGVVKVNGDRVEGLVEKPTHRSLINAGLYVVDSRLIRSQPQGEALNMTDIVVDALAKGKKVVPFPLHEVWLDIGTPEQLSKAHRFAHVLDE